MLKELRKKLKSEIGDNVFDIVLYGSATREGQKANDIDIMIIFSEGTLKERLDRLQSIKQDLKIANIDLKQMLLKEFFSPELLAKKGVLLEGLSVKTGEKFCERLGFKSYTLFFYSLEGKTHTQKIKFNYLLAGRTAQGILKELQGERIVSGCIKIPIGHANIFEEILNNNKIKYSRKNIME